MREKKRAPKSRHHGVTRKAWRRSLGEVLVAARQRRPYRRERRLRGARGRGARACPHAGGARDFPLSSLFPSAFPPPPPPPAPPQPLPSTIYKNARHRSRSHTRETHVDERRALVWPRAAVPSGSSVPCEICLFSLSLAPLRLSLSLRLEHSGVAQVQQRQRAIRRSYTSYTSDGARETRSARACTHQYTGSSRRWRPRVARETSQERERKSDPAARRGG